jgi:hypothetical protein
LFDDDDDDIISLSNKCAIGVRNVREKEAEKQE